tara:strand:- start:1697 stop:2068 length:372 start_codon:yes stop_codon:yes gene_type:complete
MKNLVITALQKKTSLFLLALLVSCTAPKEVNGAYWTGASDFMFISNQKMEMHYASSIAGKKVYLGGFYEIIQSGTNEVINTIEVSELEFEQRTDGVMYCRIWGKVKSSEEKGYLLADDCLPIY